MTLGIVKDLISQVDSNSPSLPSIVTLLDVSEKYIPSQTFVLVSYFFYFRAILVRLTGPMLFETEAFCCSRANTGSSTML